MALDDQRERDHLGPPGSGMEADVLSRFHEVAKANRPHVSRRPTQRDDVFGRLRLGRGEREEFEIARPGSGSTSAAPGWLREKGRRSNLADHVATASASRSEKGTGVVAGNVELGLFSALDVASTDR